MRYLILVSVFTAFLGACSDHSTPTAPLASTPSPLFAAQGGGGNSCAPKCNAPILLDHGVNGGLQHFVARVDADGSNFAVLRAGSNPAWGPGYKKIAFSYTCAVPGTDICTMNADGTGATPITNDGTNMFPSWSPDGTKIAFVSTRTGSYQIFTMNADGTNQKQITSVAANIYPSWSPDGTKILFDSNRKGNDDIFVMNADGSNVQQLTTDPGLDAGAVWSPDGKHIAYANLGPGCDIVIMKADGSAKKKIVTDLADCTGPSWSPNGNKLAFASDVSGTGIVAIFTMNLDGSGLTQITSGPYLDTGAAWSRK
jgi:TolB protein